MYTDPEAGRRLRHDSCDPDDWGAEMLHYLQRDHDQYFERWRHEQALRRTFLRRPDLLLRQDLPEADRRFLSELAAEIAEKRV